MSPLGHGGYHYDHDESEEAQKHTYTSCIWLDIVRVFGWLLTNQVLFWLFSVHLFDSCVPILSNAHAAKHCATIIRVNIVQETVAPQKKVLFHLWWIPLIWSSSLLFFNWARSSDTAPLRKILLAYKGWGRVWQPILGWDTSGGIESTSRKSCEVKANVYLTHCQSTSSALWEMVFRTL